MSRHLRTWDPRNRYEDLDGHCTLMFDNEPCHYKDRQPCLAVPHRLHGSDFLLGFAPSRICLVINPLAPVNRLYYLHANCDLATLYNNGCLNAYFECYQGKVRARMFRHGTGVFPVLYSTVSTTKLPGKRAPDVWGLRCSLPVSVSLLDGEQRCWQKRHSQQNL